MPITIIATVGASDANSYLTVADAETYLDARLNASAWSSAGTETRKAALVEAQRTLTPLLFVGSRATDTQALAWPRVQATNPDARSVDRWYLGVTAWDVAYYGETVIPQRIKDAQAELALEFLRAGTDDLMGLDPDQNVTEKTVDVLTTRYSDPTQRVVGLARFKRVSALLTPLLVGAFTVSRR